MGEVVHAAVTVLVQPSGSFGPREYSSTDTGLQLRVVPLTFRA